jgi:hypothetical protein
MYDVEGNNTTDSQRSRRYQRRMVTESVGCASHSNAKSGDKVLEELQQFREKEFSRIPFDPWLFLNNENKFIVELRRQRGREQGC